MKLTTTCLSMILALLLTSGCSSVKWQSVDTPLTQSGLANLPALLTQAPDDTYQHEYPGLSSQQLWNAILVVLSQEGLVVSVDRSTGTLVAMLDGLTPPVRLTVIANDSTQPTVELGWYRSMYAVDATAYAAVDADLRPASRTPEWGMLDITGSQLLQRIATQAYLQHSWRFLPSSKTSG